MFSVEWNWPQDCLGEPNFHENKQKNARNRFSNRLAIGLAFAPNEYLDLQIEIFIPWSTPLVRFLLPHDILQS